MTYTTLISTVDLARNLNNPDFVIFDVRFTLDDESWGKRVYEEAHIPGAIHADVSEQLSGEIIPGKSLVGSINKSMSTPDVYVGRS